MKEVGRLLRRELDPRIAAVERGAVGRAGHEVRDDAGSVLIRWQGCAERKRQRAGGSIVGGRLILVRAWPPVEEVDL
jgi:hypothetical protein